MGEMKHEEQIVNMIKKDIYLMYLPYFETV